jgi:hypothetical protein
MSYLVFHRVVQVLTRRKAMQVAALQSRLRPFYNCTLGRLQECECLNDIRVTEAWVVWQPIEQAGIIVRQFVKHCFLVLVLEDRGLELWGIPYRYLRVERQAPLPATAEAAEAAETARLNMRFTW